MESKDLTLGQEVLAETYNGEKLFVHRSGETLYQARKNKDENWRAIDLATIKQYWILPPGITSFNYTDSQVVKSYLAQAPSEVSHTSDTPDRPLRLYVAASLSDDKRQYMYEAVDKLRALGHNVYAPIEHVVENAWDWPNTEWGLQVFRNDVNAIKDSDFVIVLTWGRLDTSSGTTWEQGFAYGVGKKVILVEMDDSVQSLMVANGRFATVNGIDGLCGYDFNNPKPLRTETEQK